MALRPAVITFRPDNFLTVGGMLIIMYLLAVAIVQGANRFGLIKLAGAGALPQALPPERLGSAVV